MALPDLSRLPLLGTAPATNDTVAGIVTASNQNVRWAVSNFAGTGASSGYINVKSAPYNAVGDGVADDTASIQAAIDWQTANGRRGIIFFPPGNYKVTSTINLPSAGAGFTGDVSVLLMGCGSATQIMASGFSGYVFFRDSVLTKSHFTGTIFTGTSTTSRTIPGATGGSFTWTTNVAFGLANGTTITAFDSANSANFITGTVDPSSSGTSLVLICTAFGGSGTKTAWTFSSIVATSSVTGSISVGSGLSGAGVTAGTYIASGSGANYVLSVANSSVGPEAMTTYSFNAQSGQFSFSDMTIMGNGSSGIMLRGCLLGTIERVSLQSVFIGVWFDVSNFQMAVRDCDFRGPAFLAPAGSVGCLCGIKSTEAIPDGSGISAGITIENCDFINFDNAIRASAGVVIRYTRVEQCNIAVNCGYGADEPPNPMTSTVTIDFMPIEGCGIAINGNWISTGTISNIIITGDPSTANYSRNSTVGLLLQNIENLRLENILISGAFDTGGISRGVLTGGRMSNYTTGDFTINSANYNWIKVKFIHTAINNSVGPAWTLPATGFGHNIAGTSLEQCDAPALVLTFADLPGQSGVDARLLLIEGAEYDISDCKCAGATCAGASADFLTTASGGYVGSPAHLGHRRVRYNASAAVWQVVG